MAVKPDFKHIWGPNEVVELDRSVREFGSDQIPGEIRADVLVPARGYLRARVVEPGEVIRVLNVFGKQVMDVLLYDADNIQNCASMSNTILANGTSKLSVGSGVYAKNGQQLVTLINDTAGIIALDGGYCSDAVNELRWGVEGSPNCRGNLVLSMQRYGLTEDDLQEGCFTVFLALGHDEHGNVVLDPSPSKPGDYVEFRAERRLIVSASACPSDRSVTNNHNPSPMKVFIYRPQSTETAERASAN